GEAELRIAQRDQCIHVPAVQRLVSAADDLDVFSRHRCQVSLALLGLPLAPMTTRETLPPSDPIDAVAAQHRETARRALEEVCSGRDLAGIDAVYGSRLVDHVNALQYPGTD